MKFLNDLSKEKKLFYLNPYELISFKKKIKQN